MLKILKKSNYNTTISHLSELSSKKIKKLDFLKVCVIVIFLGGIMEDQNKELKEYIIKTIKIRMMLDALDDPESIAELEDDLSDVVSREGIKQIKILSSKMSTLLLGQITRYVKNIDEGMGKNLTAKIILYYVATNIFESKNGEKSLDVAFEEQGVKREKLILLKDGIVKSLIQGINKAMELEFDVKVN